MRDQTSFLRRRVRLDVRSRVHCCSERLHSKAEGEKQDEGAGRQNVSPKECCQEGKKKKERKLDGEFQTFGFSSLLHSWPVEVNLGSSISDTVGHQKRRVGEDY